MVKKVRVSRKDFILLAQKIKSKHGSFVKDFIKDCDTICPGWKVCVVYHIFDEDGYTAVHQLKGGITF